ncbi:MAG TPA: cytidine deaminase [Lachnospiraceae bacterium]|nr:cytidine deaminase [Lachnospiraceae bacterium]
MMKRLDKAERVALWQAARQAREYSYCPYSGFAVGAALLCEEGTVVTGCNIENAAFGPTICAERTAVVKAVSEGRRSFRAIAIVGGPADGELTECYPCGVCRQVLSEFVLPDRFEVICGSAEEDLKSLTIEELLPHSFALRPEKE